MPDITVRRITDVTPSELSVRRFVRAQMALEDRYASSCKECPKPVWFTAFFDGTGNNFSVDGGGVVDAKTTQYSNIAKMAWFAHPINGSVPRVYAGYVEGVGTPCGRAHDSGKGVDSAAGMATARKGQARIDVMFDELEIAVNNHWPFVSQINLAVFGFSRGAAQARAFVNQINGRVARMIDEKPYWKKANVNGKLPRILVYFMGIFDTVASTGFGGSVTEARVKYGSITVPYIGPYIATTLWYLDDGGHAEWANHLEIPKHVVQCVHFTAAHELREKFPLDSVTQNTEFPSNCLEIAYPGMHSDVGGGYAAASPGYQEGRGNELSRIPLCNMYLLAFAAGVPFRSPKDVLRSAGSLFEISEELERCFKGYINGAPERARIESSIMWHMTWYYEWRESRRRRLNDGRLRPVGGVDKYMKITDSEWAEDIAAVAGKLTGHFRRSAPVHEVAMYSAYKHELVGKMSKEQRADFDLFFDRYVHDSVAGFKKQMVESAELLGKTELSRWSVNRRVFMGKRKGKFVYWQFSGYVPDRFERETAMLEDVHSDKNTFIA